MTIYLDAVWLLNFLLDLMLLLLTQILAKQSVSKLRMLIGAFVASLLVPISLYYPDTIVTTVIGKFCYSVLIILSAFGFYSLRLFSKLLLLFYFVTFAIGGGLIALHFVLQNPIGLSVNGALTVQTGFGDTVSWLFIVVGFPVVWWFTKKRMDKHATEKIRYDQMYPVTIEINGESQRTMGYIDSGNQLVDPLTRRPVIICDKPFLSQWFHDEEWKMLKQAQENLDFTGISERWQHLVQLVPFQGVNGANAFMLAIKPDQLIIQQNGMSITTKNLLIGVQFGDLTYDARYHCLLNPQIIKMGTPKSA